MDSVSTHLPLNKSPLHCTGAKRPSGRQLAGGLHNASASGPVAKYDINISSENFGNILKNIGCAEVCDICKLKAPIEKKRRKLKFVKNTALTRGA